jgi:lysozyme
MEKIMDQQSEIIQLLRQEEGLRYTAYLDILGYPTIGVGFKLGPQGASLSNYTFSLNDETINSWLNNNIDTVRIGMMQNSEIGFALNQCNQPRHDILISMAYQMGITGLGKFHCMLDAIAAENWDEATSQMLNSAWAKQTPERVKRHAKVMKTGEWQPVYNF